MVAYINKQEKTADMAARTGVVLGSVPEVFS